MSILQAIHTWSKTLPKWQQDAIARLYSGSSLTVADEEDLYALAKIEAGIDDPNKRQPKCLEDAQIASPVDPTRVVKLLGIKDLSNINAIANGSGIPVAAEGLTVIYGENGAGKSGYSRLLKHACRARDKREPILPDARLEPSATVNSSAKFHVVIDGVESDLEWMAGKTPPEPLSEISIFDSYCARAYIDNHGDFAFKPYGLDILENLVKLCARIKERATEEKNANSPSDAAYSAIATDQTEVGRLLKSISKHTKTGDVEALAILSENDLQQLTLLTKTLSEADPKQKAQDLRQRALRLAELKARVDDSYLQVDGIRIENLKNLIGNVKKAEGAAELASTSFKSLPNQLTGTGGDSWKLLFDAAREFACVSHPNHTLSDLPSDALCPLCQNPLGVDGAERLKRFDSFVKQTTEALVQKARKEAKEAYRTLQTTLPDFQLQGSLVEELKNMDADLATLLVDAQQCLEERRKQALEACAGRVSWDLIPRLLENPSLHLTKWIDDFTAQSKTLDAVFDPKAKAEMTQQKLELEARKRLAEVKDAVLEVIGKYQLCSKLQKCIDGADARGISRKSTDLSKTLASQQLADVLNVELKRLKVHDLFVVMKPESPGGKTQFKLVLELPGNNPASAILSEGEQRAIAIASFLAEIKLSKGNGGIVFDDPVSSLDHRRRWEVAERLAEESKVRQVIVFTHDIYFLAILEQKAESVGTSITKSYIRRASNSFGVPSQGLPFDVVGTKARIAQLRSIHREVVAVKALGDDDKLREITARAYGKLRLTWERCVEEVLLNGVVQRFGEGVSTMRLKAVSVSDEDYRQIYEGMTKSSKFEHDAASAVGRLPIPDSDELLADIENLETFRASIENRNKNVQKARG